MGQNIKLKELATKRIEYLVKQGVCKEVLTDYKEKELVYYSDFSPLGGMLFWCTENGGCPKEVVDKINELKEKGTIVYHVTHEHLEFGECWDLWCVTEEDLDFGEEEFTQDNITFAYVMNASVPEFSEYGSIAFKVKNGGAIRVS